MKPARIECPEGRLIEAGGGDRALHDPRHGSVGESAGANAAVSIDFAEDGSGRNAGGCQPGIQGLDGPELCAVRDRQRCALAFLVGFGVARMQEDSAVAALDLIELESDEFGSAQRAAESDQ
jgi:hypothetical protein